MISIHEDEGALIIEIKYLKVVDKLSIIIDEVLSNYMVTRGLLTMMSPSEGTIERVERGSFACQQVPSCLNSQLLVQEPRGVLSKHTSRDATPTPHTPETKV